jgi:hypothetical protein
MTSITDKIVITRIKEGDYRITTEFHLDEVNVAYTTAVWAGGGWWLDTLMVNSRFRRQGIGRFAVQIFLEDFHARPIMLLARPFSEPSMTTEDLVKFLSLIHI